MKNENQIFLKDRKSFWADHGKTILEIAKWLFVLWLIWPIRTVVDGSFNMVRVLTGIALFVIFSGKLFYDTIIMDMIRQKRKTLKQDIFSFLGMILIITVFVGLVLGIVAFFLVRLVENSANMQI